MEGNAPNKTLFIRGLAWAVESKDLDAFFKEQGAVSAKVLWDREKNRSKGCGFIECETDEKAAEIKAQFDGKEIMGRVVNIDFARPREAN